MREITIEIVEQLIKEQFPIWQHLTVKPVEKSGHDNRTFYLGDTMTVRLPSGIDYVPQVEKEMAWLPRLQPAISLPISCPIAKGKPSDAYPFPWSINRYIVGDTASYDTVGSLNQFGKDLSTFLRELQAINTVGGPIAGQHNFYRGASLMVYHDETEAALGHLADCLPTTDLRKIWDKAIQSKWHQKDVWIHGDIAPGNLLVSNGKLSGVIDFGIMGVGDPACDYAMAWTFFDKDSRIAFLDGLDEGTICRARGWALWKALITYNSADSDVMHCAHSTIQSLLECN